MIKVLVVDDHDLVRMGISRMLGDVPGLSVVGEADCGENAVTRARELKPDTNPRNRASTRTTSHGNPWRTRPNTNTWHPETTVRQTDEFSSEDTDALRDRLRADRKRVLDDSK